MTADDLLAPPATRPLWLVTLADLALLLVGFLVLVQASAHRLDAAALARGLRAGFTAHDEVPLPVAATALPFAPGSAILGGDVPVAWAREALADPRVAITVTGGTDATAADVDLASGSAAILAADRARAVVTELAAAHLDARRITIATAAPARGRRGATLTLAFAGEPARTQP